MAKMYPAVKALIVNNSKYLILETGVGDDVLIDLPGGKVEFGESPEDALHREIKEEVGIEAEIIKPLGAWYFFWRKKEAQAVCTTYLCKPKSMEIDITKNPADENITNFKWQTKEEILARNDFPHESLRKMIQDID